MDEFGVLTERYGLKPQGKSAPMAASKPTASSNTFQSRNSGFNSGFNGKSSFDSGFGDLSFQKNTKPDSYDDFFGSLNQSTKHSGNPGSSPSSFDYDSIFFGSKNSDPSYDDVFDGIPGFKSSVTAKKEDPVRSFPSSLNQTSQIDDLFGDFSSNVAKTTPKPNGLKNAANNAAPFDGLISGFGDGNSRINRASMQDSLTPPSTSHTKSTFSSAKDPFIELESASYNSSEAFPDPLEETAKFNNSGGTKFDSSSNSSPPFRVPPVPKPGHKAVKVKSSSSSPIEELEDFAKGKVRNNSEGKVDASTRTTNRTSKDAHAAGVDHQQTIDDLDSFFNVGPRSKSAPRSRTTTLDPLFEVPKYNKPPEIPKPAPSAVLSHIKKSSSAVNLVDDFFFGDAPSFGHFEEVDGESEERRRARLRRLQRTQERAARAVADLNQRDFQTQHEQEEKRRIAESLDIDIKRWAAGKEGNMRALLSSLQYVLWSGSGWEPVSLTEMITSTSVKKVYRKAVLCIHPDKVQQKGASIEQKYTAEKVFDILKEAWNKFSKEEL
ncbi:auxilin-related protein 1 [Benincasa hispida]|uniref:auxilin-related protein 1 n=1 Tax=Benincasa hispida TaxID=102211 RepID=UPI0018FF7AD0|nr:auxilin-related protein 1 [Benincasa hispida]